MKEIQLTKGMVALVDDSDYEFLNQWKSYSHYRRGYWYAARNQRVSEIVNGQRKTVSMHHAILGLCESKDIDHRDRNTLNNQRGNLRIAGRSGNIGNQKKRRNNTTGFKGVSKTSRGCRFSATIAGKWLGQFSDPVQAARAYDKAALEHYGEFALTNVSLGILTQ